MNILLILVAMTSLQASLDYAQALNPIVAKSVAWMRSNGHWTQGPVTVDVDSYMLALNRAGRSVSDQAAFRGSTGVERSTKLDEVRECSSPVMCTGIRDNGLHLAIDSLSFVSDTEAQFFVTVTVTDSRPVGSATCTVLLEIGARLNPGGRWVPGEARWLRQC